MALRVVSWNIDRRPRGLDDRLARIRQAEPDVVLLQEVSRAAADRLVALSGSSWAEVAVLHSEPDGGPSARIGPAILGGDRVELKGAGQVPARLFVEAGAAAGLTAQEVAGIGWRHKTLYADVEIDGRPMRLCSLHARPGTGGGRGTPYVGWAKQLFHRVCAAWLAEHDGATVVGVDANSPKVDHPDPACWEPFMAGEATLIGPAPEHRLTDALRRWLDAHPDDLERVMTDRPQGPLAVTYVISQSGAQRRYDHLLVSDDLHVEAIEHRQPDADGSDHGMIVADLVSGEQG